ncbi:MAG: zinc ribbon domain-containing protein [Eubacterium sp.]|nr:zinc ribbon domain-containing protein [Eubacterium sp.]
MFCEECGSLLPENVTFCPKCGHGIEGAAPVPAAPAQPLPMRPVEASAGGVSVKKAAGGNLGTALSIVFCVLIVLLGIWVSVIYLVRHVTSEKVIDSMVEKVDFPEIEVGFLSRSARGRTLAEYISEYAGTHFPESWETSQVEKILEKDFIKDFAVEKVNAYVSDLFYGTGEGVIEVKELRGLLEDNESAIYNITKIHIIKEDLDALVLSLESEDILDNTRFSKYRQDFSAVRILCSYWMLVLMLIAVLALAAGIFLVQGEKLKGLLYLGISLFSVGAVDLITSIFIVGSLAEKMNDSLALGSQFWEVLFEPVRKTSVTLGVVLAVAGVVSVAAYLLVTLLRKNAGKPEKMRAA